MFFHSLQMSYKSGKSIFILDVIFYLNRNGMFPRFAQNKIYSIFRDQPSFSEQCEKVMMNSSSDSLSSYSLIVCLFLQYINLDTSTVTLSNRNCTFICKTYLIPYILTRTMLNFLNGIIHLFHFWHCPLSFLGILR